MEDYEICWFIKYHRLKNKMTQKQLADRLYISEKAISKWETGRGLPSLTYFLSLLKIFGVSFKLSI